MVLIHIPGPTLYVSTSWPPRARQTQALAKPQVGVGIVQPATLWTTGTAVIQALSRPCLVVIMDLTLCISERGEDMSVCRRPCQAAHTLCRHSSLRLVFMDQCGVIQGLFGMIQGLCGVIQRLRCDTETVCVVQMTAVIQRLV